MTDTVGMANSGELEAFHANQSAITRSPFKGVKPMLTITTGDCQTAALVGLSCEGPSLGEYLGGAKASIDQLLANSPEGELELTAGFLQHRTKANWNLRNGSPLICLMTMSILRWRSLSIQVRFASSFARVDVELAAKRCRSSL
jgi:hypothetical protein